jgi:cytochrome c
MPAPIPIDIPLTQPAPAPLLVFLLVVSFLLHILFVLLMVGGSILTVAFEIKGLRSPVWDRLAKEVAATITVNKSLAVVLGVAPLLVINTLYTVYFYSANALTGTAWLMILPMVILAFLLSYAHKYTWESLAGRRGLHLSLAIGSAALFLAIPLIFLANINLMLYPERWGEIHGFLSALMIPNVLPRYFHFVAASVAVSSLFMVWYAGRSRFAPDDLFETLGRDDALRAFYTVAFAATAAQLFFGPLLYVTLPARAVSWPQTFVILIGASAAGVALWWLWREIASEDPQVGKRFWPIAGVLFVTVVFMATGRHMVRENALAAHRALVVAKTNAYRGELQSTRNFLIIPGGLKGGRVSPGEAVFRRVCSACHAPQTRLVGPPLSEIAQIYKGNPAGIVSWAKNPGKKRADYPPMPPQALPDPDLAAVADYILGPGLAQ